MRKIAILLFLSLAAAVAEGQLWSGPAAVEIQVEDQKGTAIADAQLKLQYKGVNPKEGPAPLATDSRGRATVGGLAEGPWHLEVSREGFMTYVAEINVRTKGRPTLEEALVLAGSGSLRGMRVRISKGRSAPAAPAPVMAEKPAVEKAPAPPPAPRPQITAPPETRRETPPAPPEPAPKPAPPQPAPRPAPAPAPQSTPPAIRETPPTIPPIHPVRTRSAKDRTCPDCQPGESAMSTETVVEPGEGGSCGNATSALKDGVAPDGLPVGCHVLKVTLPAGAKYSGYRYEIQDGGEGLDCPAGRDCPNGTGRWPIDPVVVKNPEGTVVLAPFEGGAVQRERRAVLTVYFKGK